MSDTPRTDALDKVATARPDDVAEADYRALCRTLERELAAAKAPKAIPSYQSCARHKHLPIIFKATTAYVSTHIVCPHCDPPPNLVRCNCPAVIASCNDHDCPRRPQQFMERTENG